MKKNRLIQLLILAAIPAIASLIYFQLSNTTENNIPQHLTAFMRQYPVKLQAFKLRDQHNRGFTEQQLSGKYSLLFFGYTSCPDICPTTLSTLNQMIKLLPSDRLDTSLQVIFISVDPERDNIEKLADYMNYFNPGFIALSGDKNEIDQLTQQLGAGYFIEESDAEGNYLISHASSIFLIDQQKTFIAAFSPPHYPDALASQYQEIIKFTQRQ